MTSRPWVKLWCNPWLNGSLGSDKYREIELDVSSEEALQQLYRVIMKGIWSSILALAGSGGYGDIGDIKLTDNIGLNDEQIADILGIPIELWQWAKAELSEGEDPRLLINRKNIIKINNWSKYQSDYSRQKPYREQKKESSKERNEDIEEDDTNKKENKNKKEKRSRGKNSNLELLKKVTTESYKLMLQESYPDLIAVLDSELNKMLLYYSAPGRINIIQSEEDAMVKVMNWMQQARNHRLRQ